MKRKVHFYWRRANVRRYYKWWKIDLIKTKTGEGQTIEYGFSCKWFSVYWSPLPF